MVNGLTEAFLSKCDTAEQLKDWVYTYLDIDLPIGWIDPDSNSSPAEALFEAYSAIRFNKGGETPGFVVYSGRECYKTLSTAILEVLAMVHFGWTVAHMAAIESQAKKSVQYVSSFLKKIEPFLKANRMEISSQNTRNLSITDKDGNLAYIAIIICTLQGANSEHVGLFVVDEVDVVRFPKAYEEAKLIPGMIKGSYPITIKTSTRKFAFGLMQKEIENAPKSGEPVLHWNIIDVTEKCPASRHRPDLPKEKRYIHPRLPLQNLSESQWNELHPDKAKEFDTIDAYGGCAGCPILPVCRTRLATRPDKDRGGLYKPISFTINQFRKISPDMAEAQLMCWKPSSIGLVYGRFDPTEVKGNTYTVEQAWEVFSGEQAPKHATLRMLTDFMLSKGIKFYAGVDWGFRHAFAITVSAIMPNGEWWLVDTHAVPGLEFEDMIKLAEEVRDTYRVTRWFADTAQPMFIKAFKKRRMPCPSFDKDVMGGIESVRGRVVDASSRRFLKVIKSERNEFLISGFKNHHFVLDAAGNITQEPDDEDYADVMDSIRYQGQNLFGTKGKGVVSPKHLDPIQQAYGQAPGQQQQYPDWISQKIHELTGGQATGGVVKSKSGTIIADFGGDDE